MIDVLTKLSPRKLLKQLGPGLITGAADDDPSGIATYSQAGAEFGYSMLWTVVFTYPLMVAIQMVSARLGCLTGRGLAANIKAVFPRPVLYAVVALLLIANTINIAADIAAMGQALQLLLGGPVHFYSVSFGLLCLLLQIFLRYEVYVRYLKWLTLALLSYVAVVFTAHVSWIQVIKQVAIPTILLNRETITIVVALFGTTISPYLFFWQAAQEMEDRRLEARNPNRNASSRAVDVLQRLRRIRWDTYLGMFFSNLIAFFIILSTAATLHASGITNIQTSAQAAEALRPLGGQMTFLLFSLGIIGTGMLAIPVLAGSAAYAITESFDWKNGLDMQLRQARGFYGIVAFATLGGVLLDFTTLDPIRALLWSAILNGVIAVPIMAVMMILSADSKVLGSFVVRARLRRLGWLATIVMASTVMAMVMTMM